jgi:hypothetical protein
MGIFIDIAVSTDSDWTAVMVDFHDDNGAHLGLTARGFLAYWSAHLLKYRILPISIVTGL